MTEKYADLPAAAKIFLEQLNEEQVTEILEVMSLYRGMTVETQKFLRESDPRTLQWLRTRRPEEIEQLNEAISLLVSSKVVGRFMRIVVIGFVSSAITMFVFGEWIGRIFGFTKGVSK